MPPLYRALFAMMTLATVATTALLAPALVPPAYATPHADEAAIRKEIETQYARLEEAYRKRDLKFLKEVTTDDFEFVLPAMKPEAEPLIMKKEEMIAMIKQGYIPLSKSKNFQYVIDKFEKATDAEAVVVTTGTIEATANDTQAKPHDYKNVSVGRATWINTGNGWKIRRIELIKETIWRDGKPFDPNTASDLPANSPEKKP